MNDNEFGRYIKYLRTERSMTIRALADLIDVTPYYISYLENGKKKNPSVHIMAKLFRALNMNKSEIQKFLDLHAKANNCVSYDIADYIMAHDELIGEIRSARDKPDSVPNWYDFIEKINKM